jgi:hypothetical protein
MWGRLASAVPTFQISIVAPWNHHSCFLTRANSVPVSGPMQKTSKFAENISAQVPSAILTISRHGIDEGKTIDALQW